MHATGYDGCSTASNHSLDKGFDGVRSTLDTFDVVGLRHAGTARTPEEAAAITTYDVRGVRIAHLSYTYGFNGLPLPADAPWSANLIDAGRIHADAARARQEGAALVVVSLHWGTEYRAAPDGFQESVVSQLLPSEDIDLVIGHHAHVVQPVRKVGATYVVFGLGNELSNQSEPPRRDGLTVVASANPSFGRLAVHRPRDRPHLGRPRRPPRAARRARPRRPGHAARPRRRPPRLLRPDRRDRHLRRRPRPGGAGRTRLANGATYGPILRRPGRRSGLKPRAAAVRGQADERAQRSRTLTLSGWPPAVSGDPLGTISRRCMRRSTTGRGA